MANPMTPELGLMVAPARTYALLARQPSPVGPLRALRRPLLATVVIGVAMALSATGHVTPALALRTTIAWSFVVVLQVAIALLLITGQSRRTVGIARGLDLFFLSHAPWSLSLLFTAAFLAPLDPPQAVLVLLALVPIGVTARAIAAFFREVLQLAPRQAAMRTVLHQVLTWGVFVALYGTSIALTPRVAGWLGR